MPEIPEKKEKNWDWNWEKVECEYLLDPEEKEKIKEIFALDDNTDVCAFILEKLQSGDELTCRILEKLTDKLICKGKRY